MPEPSDYFDRLLARYLPVAVDRVRVRPRLPGPFERVEARWTDPVDDVPVAPERPARPPVAAVPAPPVRTEHTVIRVEPAPAPARGRDTPLPAVPRPVAAPSLRPAADVTPPRSAAAEAAMTQRRHADPVRSPAPGHDDSVAARPAPRGAVAGLQMPARTASPAPRAVPPPAARSIAESREARHSTASEPAVHVRIGRLEVRAAGSDRSPARQTRGGHRAAPAVDLSDYLSGRRSGAAP
jgi:hypothetical protein